MNFNQDDKKAGEITKLIHSKKSAYWEKRRETNALALFKKASKEVPAYKDFLKKNKIKTEKIKSFKDFNLIPTFSKKTYLKDYPLEKVAWDGNLNKPLIYTSTSGSTGEPFYFPRENKLDWEYSVMIDWFLKNSSYKSNGPVLVIIGFGMGVWIGGLITYKAFEISAQRSKIPISIITPGINKGEIFKAFRNLSPHYKETILVMYPPLMKDVLDEAATQGINLKKLNIRLLTAAETYTEKFRDYIARKTGIKNVYRDTLNIYGTADIGAMAWETPTSILVRRLAMHSNKLFKDIFGPIEKTPTLAQYNPEFITFESVNGEIVLTGNNTIPLIRYAVGDHGGVLSFNEIKTKIESHGFDFKEEAKKAGIEDAITELPFVYVYERNDFSTTLYGAQIYPEIIRETLLAKPITKFLTGKFTLLTKYDKKQNQYLEINLETKKNKKISSVFKKNVLMRIVTDLRAKNSEFRELTNHFHKRIYPKLVFWCYEHPLYFKPGIKQKWVKKGGD
ncbi:MAG: hypothetical protein COU07_02550 [Candidatus Harrisonbacteria bacterium CG10_big_fil_rev_8_21_14_0_10_40_38]|uniref:Phenylacetate--CoA ligase n=1 Tax=Candidatus Harrisonbacteria bacterium CG10_big_fil_rev_8_21_14_0_10_40_38 TaxID=1974583 RepID=A0A2H0UTI2_9BACT|nr:MAG: hypothetical protein COU07_02550 [Candidatus Harrisonbacteria bacterium CG10_big_fil_rev_8_21_14_0_10_40_38]